MSVTAAAGFSAGGMHCGIKKDEAFDLTVVLADRPVASAAVFTTSQTAAPPVQLSRTRVAESASRGVLINSGSANAGTGAAGLSDADAMTRTLAATLECDPSEILVCSTGPIGGRLPLSLIEAATPELTTRAGGTSDDGTAAARGIMTTDSVPKEATINGPGYTIGGMAKGAGMIRPDMATMLSVITTDAEIPGPDLQAALGDAVDATFNALNIDGCQSTNDTVIAMASGDSGVAPEVDEFTLLLIELCKELTLQMAQDAEGASKVVTLDVSGAESDRDARTLGMAVADSALVRSSFYGADPNWGRVLGALGVSGVPIDQSLVSIEYDGTTVASGGVMVPVDEDEVSSRLSGDFHLAISIGVGPGSAQVVTTDLTPDYVVFNGERS